MWVGHRAALELSFQDVHVLNVELVGVVFVLIIIRFAGPWRLASPLLFLFLLYLFLYWFLLLLLLLALLCIARRCRVIIQLNGAKGLYESRSYHSIVF